MDSALEEVGKLGEIRRIGLPPRLFEGMIVELLLQIVHRISARAEKKVVKEILEDIKHLHGKSGILLRLAEAALEEPDGRVRDVVYPAVGQQTLRDLVREFRSTGLAYKRHVQTRMRSSYGYHFRRMVPALLGALEFRSNNEIHRPVIEALESIRRHADSRAQLYPEDEKVPIKGVVPDSWRTFVLTSNG